jgi:Domain of unknown function (DUF4386)
MAASAVDSSQSVAARVAGFAYLSTFVAVVSVNFGIHDRLITDNNSETARNILAHEQFFRIGIVGDLFYCVGVVVLLTALYVILKPVNPGLALLAAFWRLVWVLTWLAMTLKLFDALRLLSSSGPPQGPDAAPSQALASLYLSTRFDYYYVGLLFGSLASTVCGYLWLKSRYIPQPLAWFGLVSSAFCVACTLIFYVFPGFPKLVNLWLFDTPMGIFDILLSFWLIIRGLRPPAG